jgi:inorganic pyrophosphatase
VDLHVKNWLDEDTGLLRYVNEMPMGTLQKFEVQPDAPQNAVIEDLKSSQRLQAFGQPVPFNYGCFPQTYRDPKQFDSLYGAPGDDDPLDVIDLSDQPAEAGAVVQCRPLGAICLIDDGQADWKVFVVNTQDPGPLAEARSVEDVERIMPGRVAQGLKWMDAFKNSAGKDSAQLQTEIHGAEWAKSLIEEDHASWKALLADTNRDGTSRGHWICAPHGVSRVSSGVIHSQPTKALVVKTGRESSPTEPGQMAKVPAAIGGASRAAFAAASVSGGSP